jgi:hypothetical protein
MHAGSIVEKLREIHEHSRKAVEASEREDWSTAEQELHKAQRHEDGGIGQRYDAGHAGSQAEVEHENAHRR